MNKLLMLSLCLVLLPFALGAPLVLREGAAQLVGQHHIQLLMVSNPHAGAPQAVFSVDGSATRALGEFDETVLPSGAHLLVKDILTNERTGMVIYYLWMPRNYLD
jgi:hypothetical protein